MEHNPVVPLLLLLAVILAAARLGGSLARRLGQPRVLGELVVGVILGPTFLDLLHAPILHEIDLAAMIHALAELGVLLLMFLVGLEVNLRELAKVGKVAGIAGTIGALAPLALAMPLTLLFNYSWQPALFVGVALAATSVSISAQVLLELRLLRSKIGSALLATALIDDVLAILLISLAVALVGGSSAEIDIGQLIGIIVRMAAYIGGASAVAWWGIPRFMGFLEKRRSIDATYGLPAFALVIVFLFGWSAEELGGVAVITGAFIAGVGFSRIRDTTKHRLEEVTNSIAYVLLVPIFFVGVGLSTDLRGFPIEALPYAALLLTVALISKVGGCGLGARLGGFDQTESIQLGVCMISRGEVGLIIASLGVSVGVFKPDEPLFASVFLVILLTTLVTPLLVRRIFPHPVHQKG